MGIKYEMILNKIILENENQKDGNFTSEVNIYNICPILENVPNIRIIDTPGFGDTRGLNYDSKIFNMIKDTFTNKCDSITVICFLQN